MALSFWMNPSLAAVFLLCAPVLGAILFYIVHKIAPMYTRLQKDVYKRQPLERGSNNYYSIIQG